MQTKPAMPSKVNPYGAMGKLFHWVNAILIIALLVLGWYMVRLSYYDPGYNVSLAWHKALGMLVLGVVTGKTVWLLVSRPTVDRSSLRRFEQVAAKWTHRLLYSMMVLIPLSGYLVSTSAGRGIDVWGMFTVPALLAITEPWLAYAIAIHYYCSYAAAIMIALHAAAALKHHFVDRDDTLKRMLW